VSRSPGTSKSSGSILRALWIVRLDNLGDEFTELKLVWMIQFLRHKSITLLMWWNSDMRT